MRLDNGFSDDEGVVQGSKEHLRTRRRTMIRTRRECSDFQISAIPPQIHMKLAMRSFLQRFWRARVSSHHVCYVF